MYCYGRPLAIIPQTLYVIEDPSLDHHLTQACYRSIEKPDDFIINFIKDTSREHFADWIKG